MDRVIIDFGQGMVAQLGGSRIIDNKYILQIKNYTAFLNLDSLSKYIRASTPEVYGSSKSLIKESSFFNPSTPYAVSHSAIDMHLRCLGINTNSHLIGRFANFYGQGQQLYRVIPNCSDKLPKKNFTLDGGGKSTRYFIHSKDILSAFDMFIELNMFIEFNLVEMKKSQL